MRSTAPEMPPYLAASCCLLRTGTTLTERPQLWMAALAWSGGSCCVTEFA